MNFLDYLVNAMTGGQPSAQELEMRKMAQQGAKEQAAQSLLSTGEASIPSQGGRRLRMARSAKRRQAGSNHSSKCCVVIPHIGIRGHRLRSPRRQLITFREHIQILNLNMTCFAETYT